MSRNVSDVLRIFRLAIGRRNENDPSSSDGTLLQYVNDFISLTMCNDVKLFEEFGTLSFVTNNTTYPDGVYPLEDIFENADFEFINFGIEAIITLTSPANNSVSWNQLDVFQDPGEFYMYWGINNYEILTPGFPTQMLFYGNEFVLRTIPDDEEYTINIYGYKKRKDFSTEGNPALPFDTWLRYIAYGAALDYANDYCLDPVRLSMISKTFNTQRSLMLSRTHNQIKNSRCLPQF